MIEMLNDIAKEIDKLPIPNFNFKFRPSCLNGVTFSVSYHDNYYHHDKPMGNGRNSGNGKRERKLMLNGVIDFDDLMKPTKHHKSSGRF